MVGTKRRRDDDDAGETPRKLRAQTADHVDEEQDTIEVQTPSKRARAQLADIGTPKSILKKTGFAIAVNGGTPKSTRKLVFETPTKPDRDDTSYGTPTIVRNADRSARRKSNRQMLERTLNGVDSDEEALDEEETLAEHILALEDEEEDGGAEQVIQDEVPVPETPSKRGRGRPKGSGNVGRPRKQRSPTPPQELPPHEEYFWQNRPGGAKTSNNTLSAQSLLNHDEYFQVMQSYQDRHEVETDLLLELHSRAYDQWMFELDEGFNICLYGYGSKRTITERFTAHLYRQMSERTPYKGTKKTPRIVVVNGYTAGITIKDVLTTIASTVVPANTKMPNQPSSLLEFLLEHLTSNPPAHPVPVILNSIDSPHLRKSTTPSMLARLAAHPSINLTCTADTPNFSLLWDVGLKTQYKFLFHDATTFAPYDAEIDIVESVNELLGRSGRRVGGRDGVGFVLRSLPENARSLFRILVVEQLALLLMEGGLEDEDEVTATPKNKKVAHTKNNVSESNQGVEYRVLYHKAVEEFVCSSEVGFRTLLKEFHDHQMVESRKDAMGTERLWVPFRLEELEGLAEDLASDAF
ncbi:ORC2-domain-containing protein [Dothidotthia symphoricarpi CBS 119687]|uniref:Origin recognition complex subunit 2 n=1 Tax=Dothidotthia symphoricarpi CBS 119687 TaxID=1392245 RepID=A0A6A6ACM5_9PLEO|nr:ORC2-domain-containing protein [Dothidotthia symphoricarpi CBS 119687]KAF2128668.1 ORC2-domain-containing protein [Dothidotthia symphoricarpi CBS 119687]